MRIISQDGTSNVPYENATIRVVRHSTEKSKRYFVQDDYAIALGRYETEERALEVMKEIKEKGHTLGTGNNWYQMPEDEEKENEEN